MYNNIVQSSDVGLNAWQSKEQRSHRGKENDLYDKVKEDIR